MIRNLRESSSIGSTRTLAWVLVVLVYLSFDGRSGLAQVGPALDLSSLAMGHPSMSFPTHSLPLEEFLRVKSADHRMEAPWQRFADALSTPQALPRIYVDERSGKPLLVIVGGLPWLRDGKPRAESQQRTGNSEAEGDDGSTPSSMEGIARTFVAEHEDLLGVSSEDLVLEEPLLMRTLEAPGPGHARGSGLRLLRFRWAPHGVPVEQAHMTFGFARGNLVQFGMAYIGQAADVPEEALISAAEARSVLDDYLGPGSVEESRMATGRLQVFPVAVGDAGCCVGYRLAWTFTWDGEEGQTWKGGVDATSGELLFFEDLVQESCPAGQERIHGGVRTFSDLGAPQEEDRSMPFADYDFQQYSDRDACYPLGLGVASTLSGKFITAKSKSCYFGSDGCIRKVVTAGGIDFGSAASPASTDCNSTATQDFGSSCHLYTDGGPGNTTAARSTYFYMNEAHRVASEWFPCNPMTPGCWRGKRLTARTNSTAQVCNAFLGNSVIFEFSESNTNCRNLGEIESVIYHEFGHFVDRDADGNGYSQEGGSREAYSDIFSALLTRDSCYGRHADMSGPFECGAFYGYVCTDCDGSRELDFRQRQNLLGGLDAPRTPAGNCSLCPEGGGSPSSTGPCGRQSHCESHVASEAFWDLATVDLPAAGLSSEQAWDLAEDLWFEAAGNITSMFVCSCPGSGSGAAMGTLYSALMAADDCDGNLLNGTPHAEAIFAAMDRHGIAAGVATDPENLNDDCTVGADLSVSLQSEEKTSRITAVMTNNGPEADPGAFLFFTFTFNGPFVLEPLGPARDCYNILPPGLPAVWETHYQCPPVSLSQGSGQSLSWVIDPGTAGFPPVTVTAIATGTLLDPDPSNNETQLSP